jgi:hypothetical protein
MVSYLVAAAGLAKGFVLGAGLALTAFPCAKRLLGRRR